MNPTACGSRHTISLRISWCSRAGAIVFGKTNILNEEAQQALGVSIDQTGCQPHLVHVLMTMQI